MSSVQLTKSRRGFLKAALASLAGAFLLGVLAPGSAFGEGQEDAQKKWDSLPESEKAAVKKNWEEFQSLGAKEQAEYRDALVKYKALPVAQKKLVQENFDYWKTLPEDKQAEALAKFAQWKELSEAERKKVREEAAKGADTAK